MSPPREILTIRWDGEMLRVGDQTALLPRHNLGTTLINFLIHAQDNRASTDDLAFALYGPRVNIVQARARIGTLISRTRTALQLRFGTHMRWLAFNRKNLAFDLVGGYKLDVQHFPSWRRTNVELRGTDDRGSGSGHDGEACSAQP